MLSFARALFFSLLGVLILLLLYAPGVVGKLGIFLILVWFLSNSFEIVPAMHGGMFVLLGKRIKDYELDEGLQWGMVPFAMKIMTESKRDRTKKIVIKEVFTPEDPSPIEVPMDLTYWIHDVYEFLNCEDPYEQMLGAISDPVRWLSMHEGCKPTNWQEAASMGPKFLRVVVATILGQEIPEDDDGNHLTEAQMKERAMTEELQNKEIASNLAKALRNGTVERGKGLRIEKTGVEILRINILSPEPSKELQAALNQITEERKDLEAEGIQAEAMMNLIDKALIRFGYKEDEISTPQKKLAAIKEMGYKDVPTLLRESVSYGKISKGEVFRVEGLEALPLILQKIWGSKS